MSKQTRAAFSILAALALVAISLGTANAADNWLGTWKLNVAKSRYSPGPGPKSSSSKIEAVDGGFKTTTDGVAADDKPTHAEYQAKFDGKDYPYTGTFETVSVKRTDDFGYEAALKIKGKIMLTSKNVISKDGKTRTQTQTGTDAQGKAVNNTVVWDRQ